MKNDSFTNRLNKAMNLRNIKQIELSNATKIDKSLINKYIKGVAEAGNDNLPILASVLDVDEVWLMGYDVPIDGLKCKNNIYGTKLEKLFSKTKDILSEDDRATIEFIMQKTLDNYEKSKK